MGSWPSSVSGGGPIDKGEGVNVMGGDENEGGYCLERKMEVVRWEGLPTSCWGSICAGETQYFDRRGCCWFVSKS